MSQKLRLVKLKEIPNDADLRREWNALAASVDRPQVFYTCEWALAVQQAYHATLSPLVFLAYDEQECLCGVVALAVNGGEQGEITFLCATTADYCDFLSLPDHKQEFVCEVLADLQKQGAGKITLTNLPADSNTLAAIRRAKKYYCFARTAYMCSQISLETIERNAKDNKPVLPRKKMVRRFLSAMSREGPVRLSHVRTWNEIEPLLPAFTQAHIARFLLTGRISNMAHAERRVFLQELAHLLAECGWVTVTCLASGEKKLAWNYGFQFQDTFFWYQPTFDSSLEKYSPGFCLLSKIIEEAAENPGLKTIDLGLGDEGYKDRFSNRSRRTLYVTLRISAPKHAVEMLRYSAARAIRALPAVEKGVRGAVSRMRRLKDRVDREGLSGAMASLRRRCQELVWSADEVFFFEWCVPGAANSGAARLIALSAIQLADAAAEYSDDAQTLTYLLRSAERLKSGSAEGFALVDTHGKFLHFAWATSFEGFFLSELNAKVDAPSPDCVMLYDCWTPPSARGQGYYAEAVTLIADRIHKDEKKPWIFSAARNKASIQGLEKSGFRRRYSLIRQRVLFWQRIIGNAPKTMEAHHTGVSARI